MLAAGCAGMELTMARSARTKRVAKKASKVTKTTTKKGRKTKKGAVKKKSAPPSERGRRYTAEQREHALNLVASGMKRSEIASVIGSSEETIRLWVRAAEKAGAMPAVPSAEDATVKPARSRYCPKDPGQGLGDHEVAAILEIKKRHPSMGPAQIRAQLKRFKGWRMANKAIARVLKANGYELIHRGSRPQGPEPIRFEAPRPNAMWQADFAEVRVGAEKRYVLLFIDDFSRFCVGHGLHETQSSETVIETLRHAIARHGRPESLRTDRGGGFLSKEVQQFLESELIDHIVGRAYSPQGGGKVESLVGTVRRELWEIEHFADFDVATRRLSAWVRDYNHARAHMGIDGLTPADRYFGRADEVLAVIDAISRKRQGALAQLHGGGDNGVPPFEEVVSGRSGAPLEVLRLVITAGVAELRFCGSRVRLGRVENI